MLVEAGAVPLLVELLLSESFTQKKITAATLWHLKLHDYAWTMPGANLHGLDTFWNWIKKTSFPDVIEQAASLFFASVSEERRAAKARVRELESEKETLKRKRRASKARIRELEDANKILEGKLIAKGGG